MLTRRWLGRMSLLVRVLLALVLPAAIAPPVQAAPQVNAKLNHALGVDQRVLDFRISPDGSRIVYRIARTLPPAQDNPPPPPADLYSVPATGGAPVQLNPPATVAAESVHSYQFSPDGGQVIFLRTTTDATLGNVFELFSVPADGSAGPTSVGGPIPIGNRAVRDFDFTFEEDDIAFGDGSVRSVNFNVRHHAVPERISSITDGTSNTFFFGEEVNNLNQVPIGGDRRQVNPGLVTGGVVYDFQITPNGTRAIYRADQNLDGAIELFSVPADGSDVGFRISGPLVAGGDVLQFKVNAGSSRAVYLADQTTNGVAELYSARTNGGIVTKLNAPLTSGGAVSDFQLSPDGNLVVYLADQLVDNRLDLFAVATTGSAATLISGGLVGATVRSFLISPDGANVFFVDTGGPGTLRLASRPLALGLTALTSYPGPPVAILQPAPDVKMSADSSHLVYLADSGNDGKYELVSIDLTATPVVPLQINGLLVPGGSVRAFQISPDGQRVVYAADQNTAGVVELFSVPIDGGPVEPVSGPLPSGGNVLTGALDFQFSPQGDAVYYLADQETLGVTELFAAFDAPVVEFTQDRYVVSEDGILPAVFPVRRSGNGLTASGVRVQLTGQPDGGTAQGGAGLNVDGVDFADNLREVAFSTGEITETFTVPIKADGVDEPAETFAMQLFEPTQAVTGTQDTAEVVILDTAGAPLLADATVALAENSANNTPVPVPSAAQVEAAAVTTYTILFGNTNNAFRIDNTGALLVNNAAALNFETSPVFVLGVEARNDLGQFDIATWTVNLQDQNEPPTLANQTRSVAENTINGSLVGSRLVASDPDGDPLTFTTTSTVFRISSAGQLSVLDSTKLDFETQKQHSAGVTVSDGSLSKSATVTVNVLDVLEGDATAPAIASLSPGSVIAGGKDFKLVVSGKNFTAKSVVRWNGSDRKTLLDGDKLIALITAQDIAAVMTAKVDVLDTGTKKASATVAFAVVKGVVGIAALTIGPDGIQASAVGQLTVFSLDWTHTTHSWRTMNEMDLRLVDGEKIPLWVRYQETRDANGEDASTIILLNPDGTPAGSGRFGEAKVLENATVRLDLAQAKFFGSGETGSNVRVELPVHFKSAAAQLDAYAIEMYGVDDLGGEQGPNQMGAWTVTGAFQYMPSLER